MEKFQDKPDMAVFTTKSVYNKEEDISYVFHHEEDGAWEFIGNSIYTEMDYIILSLREIIELDITILEIADLPLGYEAYREKKNLPWLVSQSSND
jgi:hypothetical protein